MYGVRVCATNIRYIGRVLHKITLLATWDSGIYQKRVDVVIPSFYSVPILCTPHRESTVDAMPTALRRQQGLYQFSRPRER